MLAPIRWVCDFFLLYSLPVLQHDVKYMQDKANTVSIEGTKNNLPSVLFIFNFDIELLPMIFQISQNSFIKYLFLI